MTGLPHFTGRPRVIAFATTIAAGLLTLAIGRALSQPHAAPAPTPPAHHAAVTIARPATSLGGQIAPTTAAPLSAAPVSAPRTAAPDATSRHHARKSGDGESGKDDHHHDSGGGHAGGGGDQGGDGGD